MAELQELSIEEWKEARKEGRRCDGEKTEEEVQRERTTASRWDKKVEQGSSNTEVLQGN
jgi:hypothetical protein